MKDAVKQYIFIMKESALIRYSNWFKGVAGGSLNGSNGLEKTELNGLEIRAVLQRKI